MTIARLGVNIDHVATLRQARKSSYPSLIEAAKISIENGADQITIHLRKDRRHIQDNDIPSILEICQHKRSILNLEICTDTQMIDSACYFKPDWVCLVPERIEEQTTEGGLNINSVEIYNSLEKAVNKLREKTPNTKISLFIAPDPGIIEKILKLKVNAVEVHTGDYAADYPNINIHLEKIQMFLKILNTSSKQKLGLHAGHGLTQESILPLLKQGIFEEYNIGHWIVCQSVFDGLGNVVSNLKKTIQQYSLNDNFKE